MRMAPTARRWRDRLISLLVVWALWALVTTFLVQPFKIPSGSMENTLQVGDRIVVATWRADDVKRGDVVVFEDVGRWQGAAAEPGGWRGALRDTAVAAHLSAKGAHLVKRVIGLPGDVVSCSGSDARVRVNGAAVTEPYVRVGDHGCTPPPGVSGTWRITVPAGHMWVMGDHRSDSGDSRAHDDGSGRTGSVPLGAVTGTGLAIVWPVTHWAGGHDAEDVFARVPMLR